MKSQLRPAIVLLAFFTVLTGLVYPAMVTVLANVFLPYQARGSLIQEPNGTVIGSALIGQPFTDTHYFWGRPSATSPTPYNAAASSGSNLGPTSAAQRDAVRQRLTALRAADPQHRMQVPVDLVTASASGLDPDITPAAAFYQVPRVASARALSEERLRTLVEAHVEPRTLGLIGEPHVNVLRLNLALDRLGRSGT